MSKQTERRYPSGRVIKFDAHINVAHYFARWGRRPHWASDEIWLVKEAGANGVYWFRGRYGVLAQTLDHSRQWLLYGVTQTLDDDPKGFITQL